MDPTSTAVDLSPILTDLIQLAGIILLGLAAWATKKIADYFHLKNDDKARELIESALYNGINFAKAKTEGYVAGLPVSVNVHNEVLAITLNYVITHAPDAVGRLGITEKQLAEKIIARLPQ